MMWPAFIVTANGRCTVLGYRPLHLNYYFRAEIAHHVFASAYLFHSDGCWYFKIAIRNLLSSILECW
ncbi:MAG: hypothetical protein IGNPGNKH_00187 [Sodalis sp. Ffu]|nr:MAG: hypothetical protein IGNPGNKH_00187 [Sodalis sp. Ffu]